MPANTNPYYLLAIEKLGGFTLVDCIIKRSQQRGTVQYITHDEFVSGASHSDVQLERDSPALLPW
jgi:hypothetical protein